MQNLQIETEPAASLENKLNYAAGGEPRNKRGDQKFRGLEFHVRSKLYQDVPNLDKSNFIPDSESEKDQVKDLPQKIHD